MVLEFSIFTQDPEDENTDSFNKSVLTVLLFRNATHFAKFDTPKMNQDVQFAKASTCRIGQIAYKTSETCPNFRVRTFCLVNKIYKFSVE